MPDHGDVEQRLARLERRVRELEASSAAPEPAGGETAASPPGEDDAFWALDGLRERTDEEGGVVFAGAVTLPDGEHYQWQWGRPTGELLATPWDLDTEALAALAHPVRLLLLQEILNGTRTVAELTRLESVGTSGQVYHHLRQLTAGGWLQQRTRGEHAVPGERVVPLLVVLAAVRR